MLPVSFAPDGGSWAWGAGELGVDGLALPISKLLAKKGSDLKSKAAHSSSFPPSDGLMDEQALLQAFKTKYGVPLKRDWIRSELERLRARGAHPATAVGDLFASFLASDLKISAESTLPKNICDKDNEEVTNVMVQMEEAVDIGAGLEGRYHIDGPHRTLKLALTDGTERIYGIEKARIPAITMKTPAGIKFKLIKAPIKRGILLLTAANIEVVGGKVESLEKVLNRNRTQASRASIPAEWLNEFGAPPERSPAVAAFRGEELDGADHVGDPSADPASSPGSPRASNATPASIRASPPAAPGPGAAKTAASTAPPRPPPSSSYAPTPPSLSGSSAILFKSQGSGSSSGLGSRGEPSLSLGSAYPRQTSSGSSFVNLSGSGSFQQPTPSRGTMLSLSSSSGGLNSKGNSSVVSTAATAPVPASSSASATKSTVYDLGDIMDVDALPADAFDDYEFNDHTSEEKKSPKDEIPPFDRDEDNTPPLTLAASQQAPVVRLDGEMDLVRPKPSALPDNFDTDFIFSSQEYLKAQEDDQPNARRANSVDDDFLTDNFDLGLSPPRDDEPMDAEEMGQEMPFAFLADQTQAHFEQPTKLRIMACVVEAIKPFGVVNGKFEFRVRIDDGTDSVVAKLSSETIEKLVGVTPQEFQALKANPVKYNELVKGPLARFQNYLRQADTAMQVVFGDGEPQVVEFEDWNTDQMASDGWQYLNAVLYPPPEPLE